MTAASPCGHYRRFYFLHSAFVLAVLVLGVVRNGGDRKYIPVNQEELVNIANASNGIEDARLSKMKSCRKAYVNVRSSAVEEDLAVICCSDSDYSSNSLFSKEIQYQSNLCDPRIPVVGISTQQLPFARRLNRLTEAWALPLLPIIIRLVYQLVVLAYWFFTKNWKRQNQDDDIMPREATSISSSRASSSPVSSTKSATLFDKTATDTFSTATDITIGSNHEQIRTTIRRLLLYFFILSLRGFGLYIGANALEDYVILPWITGNTVNSPLRTNSMSDVEHDVHYGDTEPDCWYRGILKSHHKSAMKNDVHSDCYGRPFDFSDHVVLFLAHYLPIFVMEMLYCYSFPFWGPLATEKAATKQTHPNNFLSAGMIWKAVHISLFLYLHLLVLHALYLTAVYFHTPAETLVGFFVSLIVQLPVGYLMCYVGWERVRICIGLPCEGGVRSEKGD